MSIRREAAQVAFEQPPACGIDDALAEGSAARELRVRVALAGACPAGARIEVACRGREVHPIRVREP